MARGVAHGAGRCSPSPHGGAVGAILGRHHSCARRLPGEVRRRVSQLGGGGGAGERTPSCTERGSEMVTLAVGVMKVLSGRLQRGQKYVGGESWLERQVN